MTLPVIGLALALAWWRLIAIERFARPLSGAFRAVHGHLLEMLLYSAYPRVLLGCLGSVLKSSLRLSLSLLMPSLLFALPLALGLVLSAGFAQYRPIQPGESITLTAKSEDQLRLQAPSEVRVEVDGFHHRDLTQTTWRLRPSERGRWRLTLAGEKGANFKQDLVVGERSSTWISPFAQVGLQYPQRVYLLAGFPTPWWLVLLLWFLGFSWLLSLLPSPGNRAEHKQIDHP